MQTKNMKRHILILMSVIGLTLLASSCKDDNTTTPTLPTEVEISVEQPLTDMDAVLSELKGSLVDQTTQKAIEIPFEAGKMKATMKLEQGSYKVSLTGTLTYTDKKGIQSEVPLTLEDQLTVKGEAKMMKAFRFDFTPSNESFLIEEIFYTGTSTREGNQYDNDKYIKITNNSSHTLYADGLSLIVSMFTSEEKKNNLTPNIIDQAMPAMMVMSIPSTDGGRKYPVLPGKSIILCQTATDHTTMNPNSFSLANADFEWLSDNGYTQGDIMENPKVPNMTLIFAAGNNPVWSMNNSGFNAYAIAKLPADFTANLDTYMYNWTEDLIIDGIVYGTNLPGEPCIKIPNEWIIDAVTLSNPTDFQWLPISASLDNSWTGVADQVHDAGRYGKSVHRKTKSTDANGRKVLMDTNNSKDDFEVLQLPTLKKSI